MENRGFGFGSKNCNNTNNYYTKQTLPDDENRRPFQNGWCLSPARPRSWPSSPWKCHVESNHKPTKQTRLNYKKANMGAIKAELQQTDWDSLLDGDIHSSWSIFRNLIWELESKHVPIAMVSTKRRPKPIWMTNKVQKLLAKKRRTFSKYRSNTHPACKNANKEASKSVKKSQEQFREDVSKKYQSR